MLTYNMNILQGIQAPQTFCVTLNASQSIADEKIIRSFEYSHPVFSLESIDGAKQIANLNGINHTWFAGAYLGNGFHEDGVSSGRLVAEKINLLSETNNTFPLFEKSVSA